MILKLVKALAFTIFLVGCQLSAQEHQTPPHIRYANELIQSIRPILEKEFNLECTGDGGSMPYNISTLDLSFVALRRASIEEARELYIKCSEKLIKAINDNEHIRPYLAEYPFSAERASISISFESNYGPYADNTVAFLSYGRNQIHYAKNDPITGKLIDIHVEPYSEALKIVQKSTLTNVDLHSHKSKAYENNLDLFLQSFTREVKSKWGIKCIRAGGNMFDGIKEFAFLFSKHKRTTVEEARKLEVGINNLLLNKINADEKLRPFLAKYPFTLGQTKIKLLFLESDNMNFWDGSLCSVFQENSKIQYHVHDTLKEDAPTLLDPILIKEETYDEALKILKK